MFLGNNSKKFLLGLQWEKNCQKSSIKNDKNKTFLCYLYLLLSNLISVYRVYILWKCKITVDRSKFICIFCVYLCQTCFYFSSNHNSILNKMQDCCASEHYSKSVFSAFKEALSSNSITITLFVVLVIYIVKRILTWRCCPEIKL